MKALFVCTDDFPNRGACTSLLTNLFIEGDLRERLEQLDVLTVKYEFNQNDEESFCGISVYRVLAWQFIYVNEIRKNIFKKPICMAIGVAKKMCSIIRRKMMPKRYFDGATVRSLVRKLEEMRAYKYDVIVAVAGNFHTAEAVRIFTKRYTSSRFVIYQVDPCSTKMTESSVTLESRKQFEIKAYSQAKVILTTPIICEEVKHNHCCEYAGKFVAMEFPNVSERNSAGSVKNLASTNKIRCVFTGSIYSGIRDPRYTLELFKRLTDKEIHLTFVGVNKEQLPEAFRDYAGIVCLGSKSLEETRKIIEQSDVLINIGNIMLNQVPSKLFEYIATGKPIVNICKTRNCATLPYMMQYPYVINLFEEDAFLDVQAKELETFLLDNSNRRAAVTDIVRIYEKCTPKYCAQQMLGNFNVPIG